MILGLDISTSCTGYCILDYDGNVVKLGHIKFGDKNSKDFWQKVDLARSIVYDVCKDLKIDHVIIEESLQNFRAGFSSAKTITTLAKFNAIVSLFARDVCKLDPEYIASVSARKTCGIKIDKQSQVSTKDQILKQVVSKWLTNMDVKQTKNGNTLTWQFDEVDAFVIAMSKVLSLKLKSKKHSD